MKRIKKIFESSLFKVFSLNSVSVVIRVLGGLITSKIIAKFLGPSGLALIGNQRNFLSITDSVSTLGFQNGIIKYVAEFEKNETKLNEVLSTLFFSILGLVIILGTVLFFSADYFSLFFLKNPEHQWVFKVLAFALPWYAGNIIITSVLNGLSKYKQVIKVNIAGNITGVLLSAFLTWQYSIEGALLAITLTPAIMFVFSFLMLKKQLPGFGYIDFSFFNPGVLKNFFSYSLMALVTVVMGALVSLYIRNSIISQYGENEAGYWEAVNRISTYYLMFVSTLLTVYFFPKLSKALTNKETQKVFFSYYKTVMPLFGIALIFIFLIKRFIITILLSDEFLPMSELFVWQLTGDFLKACSLILGYEFFAKKMTKAFIITELLSFAVLYITATFFIQSFGAQGAVMAHTFTYAIYLLVLTFFFRKKIFIY